MAGTGIQFGGGQQEMITPQERQLKNERTRVSSMIKDFELNPKNYTPQMIASLERMASQYGVTFNRPRTTDTAGIAAKTGAFLGGVVDSVLLDFIPDSWYSSDRTNSAKNWGKGVGTVGSIGLTLGGAAAARGALVAGKAGAKAIANKQAARIAGRTKTLKGQPAKPFTEKVPGNSAQRRKAKREFDRQPENKGTPDRQYSNIEDAPGKVGKQFDNVDPETIRNVAENLGEGATKAGEALGLGSAPGALANYAKNNITKGLRDIGQASGWKFAQKQLTDDIIGAVNGVGGKTVGNVTELIGNHKLTPEQIKEISKAITNKYGTKSVGKTLLAEVKGSGASFTSASSDEILKFVDAIGNKSKITTTNLESIKTTSKLSAKKIKEIAEELKKSEIDNLTDAKKFLINSTKTPEVNYLELAKNTDLLKGAAAAGASVQPITGAFGLTGGLTRGRDEQIDDMYDPLNVQG